jgi:lantibiotic modifying enzyme
VGVTEAPHLELLFNTAELIADELAATAISDGDRCTWLTATVELREGQRRIIHRTGNPSVYDGDAGIAWALAQAATVLQRDDLAELARAGSTNALGRAQHNGRTGLYDGTSGIAVAALHVASSLNDHALASRALTLLDAATATTATGDDIISGAAGQLLATLAAHSDTDDNAWLTRAATLARTIVERAHRHPWGWSWPSGEPNEPGLCGLAHGASGIAWALAELATRTRTNEFDEAVGEALHYERSWFDRDHGNWPDLRTNVTDNAGGRAFPTWWCHGAAGAGISRLRLWQLGYTQPSLLAEAATAFRTTFSHAAAPLRRGQSDDFGLTICHGTAGAIELFLTAHDVLDEDEHLTTARWLAEHATAVLGRRLESWPDGINQTGAGPGLMTGLGGTLIILLRTIAGYPRPRSIALFPANAA